MFILVTVLQNTTGMAAFFIGNNFRTRAQVQSTAKVFLGRLCERIARGYCRRQGWRIRRANWRFAGGEIDLLAEDSDGHWIVVEVLGRERAEFAPSQFLSSAKRFRLERMACLLAMKHQRRIRVLLVEVIGKPPRFARGLFFLLARWYAPGFTIKSWRLEC